MDKYSNEMVEKGASKIYALAARHGMRCRRLTWNPNYKGIDDWQLALRRKEQKMKEDPGMTFKEQYLNGLCGLEMLETCTEKWHTMEADSISLRDYLGLTEQEYDAYLQTAPGVSFRELLDSQRKTQRFRVYQLDLEHGGTRAFAFGGIDALHKAGFQQPPAAEYTLVYDGELTCPVGQDERDILERIFARYNQAFPPDYHGRSIAPSDVLELYDESERRYLFNHGNHSLHDFSWSLAHLVTQYKISINKKRQKSRETFVVFVCGLIEGCQVYVECGRTSLAEQRCCPACAVHQ